MRNQCGAGVAPGQRLPSESFWGGPPFPRSGGGWRTNSKGCRVNITIKMKDGSTKTFPHAGRAGGSYTKSASYEGAFVIVEDEWGKRIAIPAVDIEQVVEDPGRSW